MPITSNSSITNQYVPDFKIENLVNGQLLVYSLTDGAFINTSTIGAPIVISGSSIEPHSVGVLQLDTSNSPAIGQVLGIDVNGDLTYLTLVGGGSGSISGLTDTAIVAPVNNQYLKYSGGLWVNSAIDINDVDGVIITGLANKDVLFYNGTNWVNQQLTYTDIDGTPTLPVNNDFSIEGLSNTANVIVNSGILRWNAGGTEVEYVATLPSTVITGLATVATTGQYSDLLGQPNLAQYAVAASLSTVATTGAYGDLVGSPTLVTALDGLSDVVIFGASNGQYLKFNGSEWVNTTVSIPLNLGDLADVSTVGIASTKILKYDGAVWEPDFVDWAEITNKPVTFPIAAHTHSTGDVTGLAAYIVANNNNLTFVGLSDTDNTIVPSGYLKWNVGGTSVEYSTTIPAASITGLAPVATAGTYASLTGQPTYATVATTGVYNDLTGKPTLVTNLNGLSDVNILTPSINQVVLHNGVNWENAALDFSALANTPVIVDVLDDISDVIITTPASGNTLRFNGTNWVNTALAYSDLSGQPTSNSWTFTGLQQTNDAPVSNAYLRWNGAGTVIAYELTIPVGVITGLQPVALSNSYLDLDNLPTLFDGAYASLTGTPSTFTPTAHTHVMANITDLSIPSNLDDLTNVIVPTPSNGDFLKYNGTNWVNAVIPFSSYNIDDLGDVAITTPAANQVIMHNGLGWVNSALAYSSLSGIPSTFTPAAHTHVAADVTDLSAWLVANNSALSFTGLSETNNTALANGYLRWNAGATQINYSTTIAAADITGLAPVATAGTYASLTGQPSIPSLLDDFTDVDLTVAPTNNQYLKFNGTEWVASTISYAQIIGSPDNNSYSLTGLNDTNNAAVSNGYLRWNGAGTTIAYELTIPVGVVTGLATVATSGAYADISGTPTIPVNNDFSFTGLSQTNPTIVADAYLKWNIGGTSIEYVGTIPYSDISGLATVASTGAYSDLSGTPILVTDLEDLTDVVFAVAPVADDFLMHNGLAWVASGIDYSQIANTPAPATYTTIDLTDTANLAVNNGYLRWNGTGTQVIYEATISAAVVTGLATVATSGDYNDLINPAYIPVNNDFTFVGLQETADTPVADGFLRWNAVPNQITYTTTIPSSVVTGLAPVATAGTYASLTGVPATFAPTAHTHVVADITDFPTLFDGAYASLTGTPTSNSWTFTGLQQTNDTALANGFLRWNGTATTIDYSATISTADITGLATVATTGDYTDLINTPTIPSLLSELSDVDLSTPPVNNQVLRWDTSIPGGKWVAGSQVDFLDINGVTGTPVSNAYLRWNTAANIVVYETVIAASNISGLSPVATSGDIGDLANVDTTSLLDGNVLVYDLPTEKWVSQASPGISLLTYSISDLGDVNISTPVAGEVIRYNGTEWVDSVLNYTDLAGTPTNNTYSLVGLSDTSNSPVASGFLRWNGTGTQVTYQAAIAAVDVTGLATVATTGAYADLSGTPTIPTDLHSLSDVTITSPVDGNILVYSSGEWVNDVPASASLDLNDLTDVATLSPVLDDVLAWNGVDAWINVAMPVMPSLATVATTGDFNDLINQPTYSIVDMDDVFDTPVANGFLRWDATPSSVVFQASIDALTDISNLSTVATTGDWADLTTPPTSADFSFTGLSDVNPTPVANRFLKWSGTEVQFATMSVDALTEITNLKPVATVGELGSLDDVDETGLQDGYFLVYDLGTDTWVVSGTLNTAWTTVAANTAAVVGDALMVDTTLAARTITLPPTPSANDQVRISDYAGTFNVNECIVTAAHDVNGSARDYNITRKNSSLQFTFIDVTEGWRITSGYGEETTWRTVAVNTVAVDPMEELMVDTSGGIIEVTLPTSPEIGDRVKVCDLKGTFPLNKCTIVRPNVLDKIMGITEDLDITSQNATIELTFMGGTVGWKITEGIGELSVTANDIDVNLDIYVETTGNDGTGTGTLSAPYATLNHALEQLGKSYIANDVFVTINVGEGEYTSASTTIVSHAYGNRIKIRGEAPTLSTNIVSVNGTPTLTAFTIEVADSTGFLLGDFVKIAATGGTNEYLLVNGVYEITAVNTGPHRITFNPNYQGNVADLTGITLSAGTIQKQKTILKYTGCNGIQVVSGQLKLVEDVTIVGDNTASTNGVITGHSYGVSSSDNAGGTIDLGTNVCISTFGGYGVYATHGGYINCDQCTLTRNSNGIYSGYNSVVSAKQTILANTVNVGVNAEYGGLVDGGSIVVRGSGSYALSAINRGVIKTDSATIDDKNDLPAGAAIVYAKGMSTIFIPDLTGSSVTYSPTWNTTGNGNSFIGDA